MDLDCIILEIDYILQTLIIFISYFLNNQYQVF